MEPQKAQNIEQSQGWDELIKNLEEEGYHPTPTKNIHLKGLLAGYSIREIAEYLFVKEETVSISLTKHLATPYKSLLKKRHNYKIKENKSVNWSQVNSILTRFYNFNFKPNTSKSNNDSDSSFYIERPPIEDNCYREILKPGALLRIKAPLGMGKTSLLRTKILPYTRSNNLNSVTIDLAYFNKSDLIDNIRLLRSFCSFLGQELYLPNKLDDYWDKDLSANLNATNYLQKYLFKDVPSLVLVLENVDAVFEKKQIRDDFCQLLRSWHSEASVGNCYSSTWEKIRLVIVHSTDVYGQLDINYSPLAGAGEFQELREFQVKEVQTWIQIRGLNWEQDQLNNLFDLVGGNPSLLREPLQKLQRENITIEKLLNKQQMPSIYYHLSRIEEFLDKDLNLASAFQDVINSESWVKLSKDYAFKLEALGLVTSNTKGIGNYVQVRNNLYRQYFRSYLYDLLSEM